MNRLFCSKQIVLIFCRYASHCSARYICLAANSICFRSAQTRYEINPLFAKQTYRAVGISSCVSNISKIPQGIYLFENWGARRAAFRQRKVRLLCFRLRRKRHSLPCASSPNKTFVLLGTLSGRLEGIALRAKKDTAQTDGICKL